MAALQSRLCPRNIGARVFSRIRIAAYGTFRLSHEPVDEPLQLLKQEARAAGIADRVVVMEEGVTRFF